MSRNNQLWRWAEPRDDPGANPIWSPLTPEPTSLAETLRAGCDSCAQSLGLSTTESVPSLPRVLLFPGR